MCYASIKHIYINSVEEIGNFGMQLRPKTPWISCQLCRVYWSVFEGQKKKNDVRYFFMKGVNQNESEVPDESKEERLFWKKHRINRKSKSWERSEGYLEEGPLSQAGKDITSESFAALIEVLDMAGRNSERGECTNISMPGTSLFEELLNKTLQLLQLTKGNKATVPQTVG